MKATLQSGISLIELMIAMALGLFLILGATQIYIDNKKSYAFQQSQSENQEGSRYSLLFLQFCCFAFCCSYKPSSDKISLLKFCCVL